MAVKAVVLNAAEVPVFNATVPVINLAEVFANGNVSAAQGGGAI
jgi:hypothetical protein